ncbi:MAG TPA: hypothetical protein VGX68_03515 [Thermoanaerobaculia bacterium]|nr:hypothetical protein [Thermoanaerobaculia bacterium]
MACRPAFRLMALLALLAFLAPIAALAEACDDCLWSASPGCCPPSCCACCLQSASAVSMTAPAAEPPLPDAGPADDREADRRLAADPRDVFHVPKPPLA